MKRLSWLFCVGVLLTSPQILLAQRHGGRGGGTGRTPTGVSNTDDTIRGFDRAIALQATSDQVVQFRQLTKSTQVALTGAHDLLELAANASQPDLFHHASSLTDAVDEAQTDNEKFLESFSKVQTSGLKEVTKKLGKANSSVTKQSKALARGLDRSGTDGKQIAAVVERLDKALSDFQTRQRAVGEEMGIPGEQSSQ